MSQLDDIDRQIINGLQSGFPLTSRPFRTAATALELTEQGLIERLQGLVESGRLSRFGPLWNSEQLGGAVCLCAMAVPKDAVASVVEQINAHPEVAHNYERDHALNIWFVISSERPERIGEVIDEIRSETQLEVYPMPKLREFFVGFRVEV